MLKNSKPIINFTSKHEMDIIKFNTSFIKKNPNFIRKQN
jgi:hypothetical protein